MAGSVIILTGAGISAESGVDTFRDKNGIWSRYDLREVATPEGFTANPALVHAFYNDRRSQLPRVEPNAAHFALAELECLHRGSVLVVTQNIDDLHERAGSKNLIHMHGELAKALCARCGARHEWRGPLSTDLSCPGCGIPGALRPDVVWFGEMPYHMDRIYEALSTCDLFLSIGTSGSVYPAAQFVEEAARAGARTVELNLEPSENVYSFDEAVHGPASKIVPAYVNRILSGGTEV
ncbi:Sir2 family NAD+-dependent deacetylase [Chelativorans sp. AA-79]|uniref:Sir2 family NAD+-dependent deacetylase n=1 Tax=Chelativorans sp. AA-79 TaxID=3028735 RepID=UPI0023F6DA01|nr:Sir2 family NAD+-dependent deacetylase [Chelativorans sp. AA-79]WEX07833.1 NAD-dependent protein deacylase [Chelativorans sp. AA-79]